MAGINNPLPYLMRDYFEIVHRYCRDEAVFKLYLDWLIVLYVMMGIITVNEKLLTV